MFFTVEGAIRLVFISEIFEKNHFVLEVQSQKAFFFHVKLEVTTYNVMSTKHIFFVFTTEFKVVFTYFK